MFTRVTTIFVILILAAAAQANPPFVPHLKVTELNYGSWEFTVSQSEMVVIQATSGIPLEFSWRADTTWYGAKIIGYRYGWDLMDPMDPNDPGWTTADYVPGLVMADPMDFDAGLHTLHIMVADDVGAWTLASFLLDIHWPVSTQKLQWGGLKAAYADGPR